MNKYRFLGIFFLMIPISFFARDKGQPVTFVHSELPSPQRLSVKSPQTIALQKSNVDAPKPYDFTAMSGKGMVKMPIAVSPLLPKRGKKSDNKLLEEFNSAFINKKWREARAAAKEIRLRNIPLSKIMTEQLLHLSCIEDKNVMLQSESKTLQVIKGLKAENESLKKQVASKQPMSGKGQSADADIPGIDDAVQEFPSLIKEMQSVEGETPQQTIKNILTKSKELPALEKLKDRIIIELGQKAYNKMSESKELQMNYIDPSARFFKMVSGMQIDPETGKLKLTKGEGGSEELSPEQNLFQTQLRLAQLEAEHEKLKSECPTPKEGDKDESEQKIKVASADEEDAIKGIQKRLDDQITDNEKCRERLLQMEREGKSFVGDRDKEIEAIRAESEEYLQNMNRLSGKVEGLEGTIDSLQRMQGASATEKDQEIGTLREVITQKVDEKSRALNEKDQEIRAIEQKLEVTKKENNELNFNMNTQKTEIEKLRKDNQKLSAQRPKASESEKDKVIERLNRELQEAQRASRDEKPGSPTRMNRIRALEEENRRLTEQLKSKESIEEVSQQQAEEWPLKEVPEESEKKEPDSPEQKESWTEYGKRQGTNLGGAAIRYGLGQNLFP